jgi:hypothetical protein
MSLFDITNRSILISYTFKNNFNNIYSVERISFQYPMYRNIFFYIESNYTNLNLPDLIE